MWEIINIQIFFIDTFFRDNQSEFKRNEVI